jgi:ABC-type dipeptide/oligopeptide/nickel transport system permease component
VRRVPVLHHLAWGVSAAVFNALSNKMTYLISGTIIVEYVFGVRGLAYQIYASITGVKDYPLVLASTMLFVAIIVAVNLLGEFIAIIADPRLRAA